MKSESKTKGVYIRLSEEEFKMLQKIKQKHYFNFSAYFRQKLIELYQKYENI